MLFCVVSLGSEHHWIFLIGLLIQWPIVEDYIKVGSWIQTFAILRHFIGHIVDGNNSVYLSVR